MKYKAKIYLFLLVLVFGMLKTHYCAKMPKQRMPTRTSNDPFSALGIPDLNPKALLKELETEKKDDKKPYTQLKTIEDLPKFLANSNLNEDDGIKILTKFLIQV